MQCEAGTWQAMTGQVACDDAEAGFYASASVTRKHLVKQEYITIEDNHSVMTHNQVTIPLEQ